MNPIARVVTPIGAAALGLVALAGGLAALGYDAGPALAALARGAFGSGYAITSATLVRSVPLILIGLGIAIAFRGGALNIGGEGQFYAGAVAATALGLVLGNWPAAIAVPVVVLSGALAGVLWVLVPLVLRVKFGVLEVISTLLLNFVAEALVSWMVLGPLQEAKAIYPQSDPIGSGARLPLVPGTRLHIGLFVALALAGAWWVVLSRTRWGFRLRAAGEAPQAARIVGRVSAERMLGSALVWSGALAGLAGAVEISGVTYALYQNLSPGYGFTAIAVALLARLHPLGVVAAGILFGALEAGASGMQREAGVPAVAAYLVQAVIIVVTLLVVSRSRLARAELGA